MMGGEFGVDSTPRRLELMVHASAQRDGAAGRQKSRQARWQPVALVGTTTPQSRGYDQQLRALASQSTRRPMRKRRRPLATGSRYEVAVVDSTCRGRVEYLAARSQRLPAREGGIIVLSSVARRCRSGVNSCISPRG